jgi:hypothetical protein
VRNIHSAKTDKKLCQFWGCHESHPEADTELDTEQQLCAFHEKTITDVFQTKLTAFISNESDMFTKIKSFISSEDNIRLIRHLDVLFDKSNEIYIDQRKKYGVKMAGQIFLIDDNVGLFMSYIKNVKPWLLSDSHLTDWLSTEKTEEIVDELTSMTAFTVDDDVVIHYIKSLTKENMIEMICHHVSNEIRNVYSKQSIKVE